jgi:hypothetical protein
MSRARDLGSSINSTVAGKNKVINGDMAIAQRGTSIVGISSDNTFGAADRFVIRNVNGGTWTNSQESDAPPGFYKSAKMLCTTANASLGVSERIAYCSRLEGNSVQDFAFGTSSAKSLTLSFWVKSNVTGTFIAELFNTRTGTSRCVSYSYNISSANTWEKKSFTVTGDTSFDIFADNTERLTVFFWLGAGSTWTSGTLNTSGWQSQVNANRAVGQTNLAATINNYWQVTGVQLEIGSSPTTFSLAGGDIQGELAKCQRYYYRTDSLTNGQTTFGYGEIYNSTLGLFAIRFPVTMRVAPSMPAFIGSGVGFVVGATVYASSALSLNQSTVDSILMQGSISGGVVTSGNACRVTANGNTNNIVAFQAEL